MHTDRRPSIKPSSSRLLRTASVLETLRVNQTGGVHRWPPTIHACRPIVRWPISSNWSGSPLGTCSSRRFVAIPLTLAQEAFGKGTCFYSLQHDIPTRLDFYRARVVDGLGQMIHERLFAIEITGGRRDTLAGTGCVRELRAGPGAGTSANSGACPEAIEWLTQYALTLFLDEVRADRLAEVDRIVSHVELSLTELLQKADEEIGKAAWDVDQKAPRAEGRLAQVEATLRATSCTAGTAAAGAGAATIVDSAEH